MTLKLQKLPTKCVNCKMKHSYKVKARGLCSMCYIMSDREEDENPGWFDDPDRYQHEKKEREWM